MEGSAIVENAAAATTRPPEPPSPNPPAPPFPVLLLVTVQSIRVREVPPWWMPPPVRPRFVYREVRSWPVRGTSVADDERTQGWR